MEILRKHEITSTYIITALEVSEDAKLVFVGHLDGVAQVHKLQKDGKYKPEKNDFSVTFKNKSVKALFLIPKLNYLLIALNSGILAVCRIEKNNTLTEIFLF